jgi:hypothetical protein
VRAVHIGLYYNHVFRPKNSPCSRRHSVPEVLTWRAAEFARRAAASVPPRPGDKVSHMHEEPQSSGRRLGSARLRSTFSRVHELDAQHYLHVARVVSHAQAQKGAWRLLGGRVHILREFRSRSSFAKRKQPHANTPLPEHLHVLSLALLC